MSAMMNRHNLTCTDTMMKLSKVNFLFLGLNLASKCCTNWGENLRWNGFTVYRLHILPIGIPVAHLLESLGELSLISLSTPVTIIAFKHTLPLLDVLEQLPKLIDIFDSYHFYFNTNLHFK